MVDVHPDPAIALTARFLKEASALDPAEIVPLRADAALAEKNVAAGVAAVLAYDAHVAEHLPAVDLAELRSLPDLARAVVVAAREAGGDDELGPLFAEACALRRMLRAVATGLVEAGVLGARDLARLSPERGATDVGADCALLAGLFQRKAEEIEGKSAAGAEEVARAAEVGLALRAHFKPTGSAKKAGASGMSPAEARDSTVDAAPAAARAAVGGGWVHLRARGGCARAGAPCGAREAEEGGGEGGARGGGGALTAPRAGSVEGITGGRHAKIGGATHRPEFSQ